MARRYSTSEEAEAAIRYLGGALLDGRPITLDRDPGFLEGRQYSRSKSSKQLARAEACRTEASPQAAAKAVGEADMSGIADAFGDELDRMSAAPTPPSSQPQTPESGPSANPQQAPTNTEDGKSTTPDMRASDWTGRSAQNAILEGQDLPHLGRNYRQDRNLRPHMCNFLRGLKFCRCGVLRVLVRPPSRESQAAFAPARHISFGVEPAPAPPAPRVQAPSAEPLLAKEASWRYSVFQPPPLSDDAKESKTAHRDGQQEHSSAQRPGAAAASIKKWQEPRFRAAEGARDTLFDPQHSSPTWLPFSLPVPSADMKTKMNPDAGEFSPTLAVLGTKEIKTVSAQATGRMNAAACEFTPDFPLPSGVAAPAPPVALRGAWGKESLRVEAARATVQSESPLAATLPLTKSPPTDTTPTSSPARGAWANGKPARADAASAQREGADERAPPCQPKITASAAPPTALTQGAWATGKPACVTLVPAPIHETQLAASNSEAAAQMTIAEAVRLNATQERASARAPQATQGGDRSIKGFRGKEEPVTQAILPSNTPAESTAAAAVAIFKEAQALENEVRKKQEEENRRKREEEEARKEEKRKRKEDRKRLEEERSRNERAKAEARQKKDEETTTRAATATANKKHQETTLGYEPAANYYALLDVSVCVSPLSDENEMGESVQADGEATRHELPVRMDAKGFSQRCVKPRKAPPLHDKTPPSPGTAVADDGRGKDRRNGSWEDTETLRAKEPWRFSKFEPPAFNAETENEEGGAIVHASKVGGAPQKWQLRRLRACAHARDTTKDLATDSGGEDCAFESTAVGNANRRVRGDASSSGVAKEGDSLSRMWRMCGGQGSLLPEGWQMCACLVPVKIGWGSCPRCSAPTNSAVTQTPAPHAP
eukprot:Tamp_03566.p1 GENE.Tamp_03566~~Tamp_03566.p1  ORF type:complete len:889 (+),score=118.66 Tamp_03566:411-3077(+)